MKRCVSWIFAATPRVDKARVESGRYRKGFRTYRTAALFSEVWQKRKRTSLRDFAKANLADILIRRERRGGGGSMEGDVWKLAPFNCVVCMGIDYRDSSFVVVSGGALEIMHVHKMTAAAMRLCKLGCIK